jgi:hypothetical protein
MKLVSRIALLAALAAGGLSAGYAKKTPPPPPPERVSNGPKVNREARAALLAAQTALAARDYSSAQTALATAASAAQTPFARYYAAALQYRLGAETADTALQASAIDSMIASGAAPPDQLAQIYRNQGALALSTSKERAEASLSRAAELAPTDSDIVVALAQVKDLRGKYTEAAALLDRAVAARLSSGGQVPESWIKRGINLSVLGQMNPQVARLSRALVTAYPSAANWRDAVLLFRDSNKNDSAARLDALRLLRASKAMAGERDYMELARLAAAAGLAGEAKAVLAEGVASGMVDPAKAGFKEFIASGGKTPPEGASIGTGAVVPGLAQADAALAAANYAQAATLYTSALQAGGTDVNVANTRLGIALALAGRRAEAEAALRSVTGPRADLAGLWLAWLARQA